MNLSRLASTSMLLGLFAAAPLLAQNAPAPAPAQSTGQIPAARIGVLNLDKVFQDLQEAKDIRARQESATKQLKDLVQAHQTELAGMKAALDQLKPDSPQYEDATLQLQQKSIQYELDLKMKQLNMARDQNRLMKSVYDKIESACADIAKQKSLDLIISQVKPAFPANVQDQNPETIKNLIQQRTLIFVAPQLDITSDVVTALDAQYKAGSK